MLAYVSPKIIQVRSQGVQQADAVRARGTEHLLPFCHNQHFPVQIHTNPRDYNLPAGGY